MQLYGAKRQTPLSPVWLCVTVVTVVVWQTPSLQVVVVLVVLIFLLLCAKKKLMHMTINNICSPWLGELGVLPRFHTQCNNAQPPPRQERSSRRQKSRQEKWTLVRMRRSKHRGLGALPRFHTQCN